MTKKLLILVLMTVSTVFAGAQITLRGKLTDKSDKSAITGATIKLAVKKDPTQSRMVVTDKDGNFAFNNLNADIYTLTITFTGYEKIEQPINLQASNIKPIPFAIAKVAKDLTGVVVVGKAPPVKMKSDTTEFNASQFKVNPDATAEDMIKKLPGIVIDKSGNVTTMGEAVKKVTVDGRDFFGDDATAALRNLPAEVIDKIQVFDKLSDQAAFTGFDDGNSTKAINIVTKAGMRNGQFGRVYAGYGTDNRYSAGGNVSFFKKDRRLSFVGLFNNINQQNFSSEDLLGVTSSGGGRQGGNRGGMGGGGNRGGNSNFGGGGNNFLVGQTNGISATNAFGINYSDKWGKKTDVSGSYFFNNSNTNNDQSSNTQFFIKNADDQFYNENNESSSKNFNHRVNLKFDFKINDRNSITFSPAVSFQKNSSFKQLDGIRFITLADTVSTANSTTNTRTSGYNSNNNLLFRHSFLKKGRTISFNLSAGFNHKDGSTYLNSINKYYQSTTLLNDTTNQFTDQLVNGATYGLNVAYTEPIGKKGQLQINYNPSYTRNKSDQEVFQYDNTNGKYSSFDSSYSSKFINTTSSQTISTSYRVGDRDNMFSVGVSYKYLELNSDQSFPFAVHVNKHFNNILPNLMWRKKISAKMNINVMYRASTNAPSVNQLQDVIDNSNPILLSSGNPNLRQMVSNTLSTRFTYTNSQKSQSFFANIFLQQASNYIANATYTASADSLLSNGTVLYKGSQLTKPVNLNGYMSLRSFLTYAMPLKFMKSNLNVNGGFTYSKTPGQINNVSTRSNNYTYSGGVVIASNISQYVDFNVSYNASLTDTKNSLDATLNTHYVTQNAGLQANLLTKKGWFLQNDISNISYSGLSAGYNQSYWLWNAGIGKKFLKNQAGELKLSVFDLLKQNRSITRTVDAGYIEDVRNQVLQQYFMLTFTYKLKNFGIAPATNTNQNQNRQMGPGGNRPF